MKISSERPSAARRAIRYVSCRGSIWLRHSGIRMLPEEVDVTAQTNGQTPTGRQHPSRWSSLMTAGSAPFALADSLGVRGIDVVAVAHNGSDGYRACVEHRPDALLVDFDLGVGPTGADLVKKMRSVQPRLGIVMFTAFEDPKRLCGG